MRALCAGLLWLAAILAPGLSWAADRDTTAQDTDNADALALLRTAADAGGRVASLATFFVQERRSPMLAKPLLSRGQLCLSRRGAESRENDADDGPDLLWAYDQPAAPGFLYRRGRALVLEVDDTSRPPQGREQAVTGAILRLVRQWMRIDPQLIASLYRVERPDASKPVLRLLPRDTRLFSRIEVTFAPDLASLASLLLEEANGATLRLTFSGTRINAPLPPRCQALAP